MNNQGHIKITVHSYNPDWDVAYPFVIDPLSYTEVDITDFAPRAIGTNVALGELGLYTDAGQDDFKHGFGKWEYTEPQSYAYSGHLVDTRHGFMQLFNNPTLITSTLTSTTIKKVFIHRNIPVIIYPDRVAAIAGDAQSGASAAGSFGSDTIRDALDSSKYILLSTSGRMRVADVAQVSSTTTYTVTVTGAGWDTDMFVSNGGGTGFYVIGGTGVGVSRAVSSNTSDTLTLGGTVSLDTTSIFVVIAYAGNDTNPPNNFGKMVGYGGYFWAIEEGTNYLHWWAEESGSSAEGGGLTDATAIQVGPFGTPLVSMASFDNQLFVFRQDGAWTVHEDNLAYQTGVMFEDQLSSSNFKSPLVWQGFLMFPVRNRLYKFKTGLQDISPPTWNDQIPYKTFGNFSHMVVRGKHMYIMGQSNAANSDETKEGNSGFAAILATDGVGWHKLVDFPDTGAAPTDYGMWLDQVNDRLYFYACVSGNPKLYYVKFESLSDFPYANYPTSTYCNLYTSYYTFSLPRIPKSFASLTLGGDFPTNTKVGVWYRIDDATTWTSLGTFTADMQAVDFPNSTTGKKIQFKLGLYTTTSGYTPVVKKLIIKLMLRPDVLYGITCDILVSDNLSDPNRLIAGLTAKQIRAALKSARDSVQPITFQDLYGEAAEAYLASIRFVSVAYEDMDHVQTIARCTIVYV